MRILGRNWNPLELILALTGLALALLTIFLPDHQVKTASAVVLGVDVIALAAIVLFRKLRSVYVLPGVSAVIDELCNLARKSSQKVWTVRSHVGEAENEQRYFDALAGSIYDGKLEDVRRIIRLNKARSTRQHIHWLVDKLADQPAVKVRYLEERGSVFDFAVFDGCYGALGFPQAEAEGFFGALFIRDRGAIKGLEEAFETHWAQSSPLFSGSALVTDKEKRALIEKIDKKIDGLTS